MALQVRLGECVFVRAGPVQPTLRTQRGHVAPRVPELQRRADAPRAQNEKDTLLFMMRVRKMWQEPGDQAEKLQDLLLHLDQQQEQAQ